MFVVTGGAGFIGSNIVRTLNEQGVNDILVVDDLTEGEKFVNISDLEIADYMDKDEFLSHTIANTLSYPIEAIFHEGACSATTEWDGKFMMENNYTYSKHLLDYCLFNGIALLYASSAATYGGRDGDFIEEKACENPLNVYGYSKLQFDNYVRRIMPTAKSQIVGFRYFNVYGPREQHKGSMASVAFHLNGQIQRGEKVKLFEGTDGYPDGGQQRDFVYIDDVCKVNLWFAGRPEISGIFNLGTGRSEPFQAVADAVIDFHKKGEVEYIPFPEHLQGRYQSFTQADLGYLRAAGYDEDFHTVAAGVAKYMAWLNR